METELAGGAPLNDAGKNHLEKLKKSAGALVQKHGRLRVNGAVASIRTMQMTREVVMACCERLWNMGFQIRDIHDLSLRHVEALIEDWRANDFALKTIQNHISRLRRVAEWIEKPGLIPDRILERMYPNVDPKDLRVPTVAVASKSWTESGVDVVAKIKAADALDARFGAMLRLGLAFGLRRKEQIRAKPNLIDGGLVLLVNGNMAKSGKDRIIPIEHPFQRLCLEHAKRIVKGDEYLGWPGRSYEQNLSRYKYLTLKIGISGRDSGCVGHGLRAEYAENIALMHGLIPPVLGGRASQMEKEARLAIQALVSQNMGHHRPEVTGAYYGSFRPTTKS